jgi:tetratricopeptide (TPR) repeat protein
MICTTTDGHMSKTLTTICLILCGYISMSWSKCGDVPQAPLFDNLGAFHHPISTNIPLAQRFFDQGLVLYYGFEWGESIRSFREATRLDPTCGMCYWGLAMAIGSKINAPVDGDEYVKAKEAMEKALSLKDKGPPIEAAYIQALAHRFAHQPKQVTHATMPFSCHLSNASYDASSKKEIANYAEAMKALIKTYPLDNDAQALYVYALFGGDEWKFWSLDGKIQPHTSAALKAIQTILQRDPQHIGANHYHVHLMEPSRTPEKALESANRLRTLVPGSEHLVHMPAHIYFRTGEYNAGSESNDQAITAFKQYNKRCREQGFQPEINYLYFHNYDYLRTTATMEGRKHLALTTVHQMLAIPFAIWLGNDLSLEWFIPISYYVKARFAMWDELLKETKPKEKYQYAIGMWHYARGLALVNKGQLDEAKRASAELQKIIEAGPTDGTLQKEGMNLLKIASAMLEATVANHEGHEAPMMAFLKTAEEIQYKMGYHEPPAWYFPVTEAMADAYLKWNHPRKAKAMYEKVLVEYPKNGWALYGLAKSQRALGETEAAARTEAAFKKAWQYADIPTPISLM